MQLFVVRHAIAAELVPGGDDALRSLTKEGIQRFRRSVGGLATLGIRISAVLHSPWLRAAQTARLLAPLQVRTATVTSTSLLARAPTPELLALITDLARTTTEPGAGIATAVVGHEPFLGELIGWLTSGDPRAGEALILKKGSVTWLEGSAVPGGMSLRALLPPRVLRALRG